MPNINFETLFIPIVVIFCLCIGYILKTWMPTDNKWIPTILAIVGAICGVIANGFSFESIVYGMLSGLASVGLHQAFKQHLQIQTPIGDNAERGEDHEEEGQ